MCLPQRRQSRAREYPQFFQLDKKTRKAAAESDFRLQQRPLRMRETSSA
jgi:hypothetical protein